MPNIFAIVMEQESGETEQNVAVRMEILFAFFQMAYLLEYAI